MYLHLATQLARTVYTFTYPLHFEGRGFGAYYTNHDQRACVGLPSRGLGGLGQQHSRPATRQMSKWS